MGSDEPVIVPGSVDHIVPRHPSDGDRHYVLRAVFLAPDDETAQRLGTEMIGPLLYGRIFDWEVVETRELLAVGDQAEGILSDVSAAELDNAEDAETDD